MTYDQWFGIVCNMLAIQSTATGSSVTDPLWLIEIPDMVQYAEQRIYRDLDLLATRITDYGTTAGGQRLFTLPTNFGTYLVVERMSVIGPAGAQLPQGVRQRLTPISPTFLDDAWPSQSTMVGTPVNYAMQDNATVLLGPTPDAIYQMEVVGTQRPTALSSGNQTTFLTTVLPDLFTSAAMVRASAYMRDFGQQSDNPQMSVSWEMTYQSQMQSAMSEETRKMYRDQGWTAQKPRPETQPPRQ